MVFKYHIIECIKHSMKCKYQTMVNKYILKGKVLDNYILEFKQLKVR